MGAVDTMGVCQVAVRRGRAFSAPSLGGGSRRLAVAASGVGVALLFSGALLVGGVSPYAATSGWPGVSVAAASEAGEPQGASARAVDFSRSGSISMDIRETGTGEAVGGGTFTVYEVARAAYDPQVGDVLEAVGAFEGANLEGLGIGDVADRGLGERLATLVESESIAGEPLATDAEGHGFFDAPELGLYLFVQDTPATGYEAVAPFLVSVPYWDGEQLVYDVYANPKPGTADVSSVPIVPINPDPQGNTNTNTNGDPDPEPEPEPEPEPTPVTTQDTTPAGNPSTNAAPPAQSPTPSGSTTTSAPSLPQTGQLWWPVALLAAAGALLVSLGALLRRRSEAA